jgi:hypothetical protein
MTLRLVMQRGRGSANNRLLTYARPKAGLRAEEPSRSHNLLQPRDRRSQGKMAHPADRLQAELP